MSPWVRKKRYCYFLRWSLMICWCFTCHHPQHEESSHWNHSDICVIDLVVQITAHAPFSSLSRDRADVFRSSQDFQHDSSCNWEKNILQLLWTLIVFGTPCVWWLVMPMRPRLTDCAGQKPLQTDRWPDTTMTGQVCLV